MTFSIIARCPHTGRLGLGIATFSIGAGGRCEGILAGVGLCKTQASTHRGIDPLAIGLLAQGHNPAHVMKMLEQNDPNHAYRQIAIIDRVGNVAAHTGSGTRPWSGHKIGPGYVAFGNVLAGPQGVEAICAGFEKEPDADLELRILAALQGGPDSAAPVPAHGHPTPPSPPPPLVAHP